MKEADSKWTIINQNKAVGKKPDTTFAEPKKIKKSWPDFSKKERIQRISSPPGYTRLNRTDIPWG